MPSFIGSWYAWFVSLISVYIALPCKHGCQNVVGFFAADLDDIGFASANLIEWTTDRIEPLSRRSYLGHVVAAAILTVAFFVVILPYTLARITANYSVMFAGALVMTLPPSAYKQGPRL